MSKSLYEIIGVNPNADVKLIEEKCLELGKKYHPNHNPNDLDAAIMYKEVMQAYATLRDPSRRVQYDASIKTAPKATDYINAFLGTEKPKNEVSLTFAVLIVFFPYIAAWFLLKDGYSKKARIISFTWLAIFAIFYFKPEPAPLTQAELIEEQAQLELRQAAKIERQKQTEKEDKQKYLDNRMMGAWKGAIQSVLVDPNSADFKDMVFVRDTDGTAYACGEVNSKNRMGGYTGYKGFITAGLKEYTLIEGETKGFAKYWNQICVRGKPL